jgi:hypothetical protein
MERFGILGLIIGLSLVLPAAAQITEVGVAKMNGASVEVALPEAPSAIWVQPVLPVANVTTVQTAPEKHPVFLDRPARIRFSILAGLIAADSITTQRVLNMAGSREVNPLARPFVTHGAAGQLAASSLGYAFGIGTSYFFHRTGHHKLERIFQDLAIGVEAACVTNNLIQGARASH